MSKTDEVQFYLPAAQVEFGDGEWGESDRVGEKHQGSVLRCIMAFDAPKLVVID